MSTSIQSHLNAIKAAAERAQGTMDTQFSAERNRDAMRALVADCFASFEALAYALGADGRYISDDHNGMTGIGGKESAVDSAFLDLVDEEEAEEEARSPYEAPYSTLNHRAQGIRIAGVTL